MSPANATTPATSADAAQLAAWRTFLEAHARVVDVLAEELRGRDGLPLQWYDVLVQLSEADDHQLRMQELAEAVLLSKSGLTRLIDRMQAAGLVSRAACDSDRRGTYAQLTSEGLARLERAYPVHLEGVREHFAARFDDDEARSLQGLLARLVEEEPGPA